MNLEEKLAFMEAKPERMGMYAIQMDHPGLMPSLKKRKTSKVDRSFLANDEDAKKQYITGSTGVSGNKKHKKQAKVVERIEKRLAEIDG